jgi:hypothetical protein
MGRTRKPLIHSQEPDGITLQEGDFERRSVYKEETALGVESSYLFELDRPGGRGRAHNPPLQVEHMA